MSAIPADGPDLELHRSSAEALEALSGCLLALSGVIQLSGPRLGSYGSLLRVRTAEASHLSAVRIGWIENALEGVVVERVVEFDRQGRYIGDPRLADKGRYGLP